MPLGELSQLELPQEAVCGLASGAELACDLPAVDGRAGVEQLHDLDLRVGQTQAVDAAVQVEDEHVLDAPEGTEEGGGGWGRGESLARLREHRRGVELVGSRLHRGEIQARGADTGAPDSCQPLAGSVAHCRPDSCQPLTVSTW